MNDQILNDLSQRLRDYERRLGSLESRDETKKNALGLPAAYPIIDVRAFGAAGDCKRVDDGKCTGNDIVTSVTAGFTAADVGKRLSLINDTTTAVVFRGATIIAVVDSQTVQLDSNGASTVSTGVGVLHWGTDDSSAFQMAFDYAENLTGPDTYSSENQPIGLGYAMVQAPLNDPKLGGGAYMICETISVPRQVIFDCPAMLVSGIPDAYDRFIHFEAGSHCYRLKAQANLGNGILWGGTGERSQSHVYGYIRLWRVGRLDITSNRQIGLEFRGYGLTIEGLLRFFPNGLALAPIRPQRHRQKATSVKRHCGTGSNSCLCRLYSLWVVSG